MTNERKLAFQKALAKPKSCACTSQILEIFNGIIASRQPIVIIRCGSCGALHSDIICNLYEEGVTSLTDTEIEELEKIQITQ